MSQEPPSRAAVTEQARDARERLERKRVRSRQAGNVEGDPSYYDERLAIEQLRNRLLHMKMMNEKNDPEKPKWFDEELWRNPGKAIYASSAALFSHDFKRWTRDVNSEVKRYERKLMVEAFEKDGKNLGIWSNAVGSKLAKYFSHTFGMDMEKPPAYYDVWTPREREVANTYLTYLTWGRLRPFSIGFAFGAVVAPMALIYGKYVARIPKLPNILALPLVSILGGFSFGLLAFPFLRPLHNRKKAMHNLMMSRDSFVAAKARKFYDDMLWPTDDRLYNRHYLRFVPRDRYDELVWSIDDSDIREGNFDRNEWNFALRKEGELSGNLLKLHETMSWPERRELYTKQLFLSLGWGFWWDKNSERVLEKVRAFPWERSSKAIDESVAQVRALLKQNDSGAAKEGDSSAK